MIKMGMGQQDVVDAGWIEPEGLRILLVQFTTTLVQPAVDQDLLAGTLDHVTRAGDAAVGAVKRQFQRILLSCAMIPFSRNVQGLAADIVPMQDSIPDLLGRFCKPEQFAIFLIYDAFVDQKI